MPVSWVPVGEVAVDADYPYVLGAGGGSDGYEEVALPGDELGFWNYLFRSSKHHSVGLYHYDSSSRYR